MTTPVSFRAKGGGHFIQIDSSIDIRKNHHKRLKRALDLGLGLPLFVFSLPLTMLAAVAVGIATKGSPFYAQVRAGHLGKPIRVWKIRTMVQDAETCLHAHLEANPDAAAEWRNGFKLKQDPRIIPKVGLLLRKSSIDELPQLWSVLTGDLSLVGPRPFPLYHLEAFHPDFRRLRHSVPPGVTGLWQIRARGCADLKAQEELDTEYVRNCGICSDLKILLQTIPAVLFGRGAV